MTDSRPPHLVLVVGVGRSGTSLMTGLLGELGFHVPSPEVVADDTNPRGFSEPRWVVDFHTRLMRSRRVTVFDSRPHAWTTTSTAATDEDVAATLRRWLEVQFVGTDQVVVKDPRTAWFLDLWKRVAGELGARLSYVTMLRHPAEVVASAKKSYGTWQNDASRTCAWLNVMFTTEAMTRTASRTYVQYEELLTDWSQQLRRVGRELEIEHLATVDAQAHPAADALVDHGLRRASRHWADLQVPEVVRDLAGSTWAEFLSLGAEGAAADATVDRLASLRADYEGLYLQAEAIAQSSINAATPRKAAKKTKPKRKPGGTHADGRQPAARNRPRGATAKRLRLRRARRLVPRRLRRTVRAIQRRMSR